MVCSPRMAIYHIQASVISRARGGSAVAAAAYRSGEKLIDERTGEQHDYSRRSGVDGSLIIAPEGAPDWVRDRDRLWNAGELSEKRKDSQVAREVRVALPRELDPEQRRELVREFAKAEFTGRGMVADVSYHDGNSGNPHAHILLTTRQLKSDGFGAKDRSWNDKGLLLRWREQWAESANRALDRAGSRERIDHRTLAEQRQEAIERGQVRRASKLDRDPQIHLGKAGAALRRRGQGNERTRRNDRICAGNRDREKERSRLVRGRWALDAEIQAVKLRVAVARGSAWASEKVKAGAKVIQEYPQRREDAKQARERWESERLYQQRWQERQRYRERGIWRRRSADRVVKAWYRLADTATHIIETPQRYRQGVAFRREWVQKKRERREWEAANPEEVARLKAEREAEVRLAVARADRREAEKAEAERRERWKAAKEREREYAKERAAAEARQKAEEAVRREAAVKLEQRRAREYADGRAEFVRSIDPKSSKEQTWNERQLGQKWKKDNWSEAWQLERAAARARPEPQRGPDRDYGPSR